MLGSSIMCQTASAVTQPPTYTGSLVWRVIPQSLADYMALQATACYLAYKEGRPFLGFTDTPVSDRWAQARIRRFQAGYMKEVNRRRNAGDTISGYGRRTTPILFTTLPMEYQKALASRFRKSHREILAENPGLRYNMRRGYYWDGEEGARGIVDKVTWSRCKDAWPPRTIVWPQI